MADPHDQTLDRRQALMLGALGVAGLLLSACSSSPGIDDAVDSFVADARRTLRQLAETPYERDALLAAFGDMEGTARQLALLIREEDARLDVRMRDPAVSTAALQEDVDAYLTQRIALRGTLLQQQDRLRTALGQERWTRLTEALNDPDRMVRIVGRSA
ncbi:MAG: hypothetical protein AAFX05_10420 [Planctomycetota bacterium]